MPEEASQRQVVIRRADRPGDLGWVVMAHGELYAEQFGFNTDFEALVAKIVGEYATKHSSSTEAAWIAEIDGERAGCVFLVAADQPGVAKLRVLLVTPSARGLGLGARLVEQCLDFARETGYRQASLWTTDNLVSARRIYEQGFTLADEEVIHSFGHDLVDWICRNGKRMDFIDPPHAALVRLSGEAVAVCNMKSACRLNSRLQHGHEIDSRRRVGVPTRSTAPPPLWRSGSGCTRSADRLFRP